MKRTILAMALLTAFGAHASCDNLYPNNQAVSVKGPIELCNTEYVTVYDPEKKIAVFSSERLEGPVNHAERVNVFRADSRLRPSDRAEVQDYAGTPYDRGHLAPAGDMSTDVLVRESFLMSNMTPQIANLNRGSWKKLEAQVLQSVTGLTWIVSGTIFNGSKYETIGNRIAVPDVFFKCVWHGTDVSCWTVPNKGHVNVSRSSLKEVNALTGLNLK